MRKPYPPRLVQPARALGGGQVDGAVGKDHALLVAAVARQHGGVADHVLQIGKQARVPGYAMQKARVAVLRLARLPVRALAFPAGGGHVVARGQVAGAGHAQRRGHKALYRLVQRHAEHPLQQKAQQDEAHCGIAHLAAHASRQRVAHQRAQRVAVALGFLGQKKGGAHPRCVGEQVQQRDVALVLGHALKPPAQPVVQADHPPFQRIEQQRHRGHHFGQQAHVIARGVRHAARIPLRQRAVYAGEQNPRSLTGRHGAAGKYPLRHTARQKIVYRFPHRRFLPKPGPLRPGAFFPFAPL